MNNLKNPKIINYLKTISIASLKLLKDGNQDEHTHHAYTM